MPKIIINKVANCQTIDFKDLAKYTFNDLKESQNRDVTKLKNNIVNTGFTSPFYVWKDHNYVIDGAGRCKALTELQSEGFELPTLPYIEIEANDLKEAKKIVLSVSSQFGLITQNSLGDFTSTDFDLEELKELKENELNLSELDYMIESLDVPDYSILDGNEDLDNELEKMAGDVKKAIQIEFEPDHYEDAYAIVKFWRERNAYVGKMILDYLQDEKNKL